MTGRFSGKVAVVTGASRGIGAAIAQRLAAEGARVAIAARTQDSKPALGAGAQRGQGPSGVERKSGSSLPGSLAATEKLLYAAGPGPHAVIVADLTDEGSRARIVPEARAALGPIDILVNNAAAAMYAPLEGYSLKRRRFTFEVNVHAPLDLAQQVIPEMRARGAGWIVNLSSGAARHVAGPPFDGGGVGSTIGVYGASKAALNRLTNALALELHGAGIRVNTVEPRAAVLSPGAETLVGGILRPDQIESMEEMVEATLALCDCPPERTGQVLVSLDLIAQLGLRVMTLDGKQPWVKR